MNKLFNLTGVLALSVIVYEVNSKSVLPAHVPVSIVNGTDAKEGEFPYEVQLRNITGGIECGGSIIGDKWILTAGHCIIDIDIKSIAYGTNILYQGLNKSNNTVDVKRAYRHPKYKLNYTKYGQVPLYDIGLLELSEPIIFSDKAKPIKLPDNEDVPINVDGLLAGWGYNGSLDIVPQHHLQKLRLSFLPDEECRKKIAVYAREDIFNKTQNLCADSHKNGPCYGDSGSPFVINGTQYGIASWMVPPCATSPSCFSRVSSPEQREFIRAITGI